MSLADQSIRIRAGEELDAVIIDPYLKVRAPGLGGTPRTSQLPGSASNLAYLIEYPHQKFVLHRPPFGHKTKSAHDIGHEYRILNQLNAGLPYCSEAYPYCTDESVIGAGFYVMERVKGIILRVELPSELNLDEQQTHGLRKSFIDKFVESHNVDYTTHGLVDLGHPDDYVQCQIADWTNHYEETLTPDAPFWKPIRAQPKGKRPADRHRLGITYSDYHFDNVTLDPDNPMQTIGVLDRESATLGDPLMGLDDTLAYWVEAGDPVPAQLTRRQPSHLSDMLTRREFADYYVGWAGILLIDGLDFYCTYGLLRLADIVQQIYYRYYYGQTQDKRFVQFAQMGKLLEQMSLQAIEHSRL